MLDSNTSPDANCITLGDGSCVGVGCMHNLDPEEYGTCDECNAPYHLGERSVAGDTTIRCGDCGNCSLHCPPSHKRTNFFPEEN